MKGQLSKRIVRKLQNRKLIISYILILLMLIIIPSAVAADANTSLQIDSNIYTNSSNPQSGSNLESMNINEHISQTDSSDENHIPNDFNGANISQKLKLKNFNLIKKNKNKKNKKNPNKNQKRSLNNGQVPENFLISEKSGPQNLYLSQRLGSIDSDIAGLSDNRPSLGGDKSDYTLGLPMEIITFMLAISMGAILIYFVWTGILALFPMKKIKSDYTNIEKFHLYVMVPCLNEVNVIENTVHKFFENHNENYRLVVLDDGSDDGTGEVLEKIAPQYKNLHIITRTFPNAQKGKGEALNEGLRYIKNLEGANSEKVIIGVIDADAFIKNEDYIKILAAFNADDELTMIQTSVGMNVVDNWLHRMQDLEFQSCITLISNVRNFLGNAAGGGNGQFFRLNTFKDQDDVWGNSLLEDFEISTRLLLEGKKTCFLNHIVVYQEPVGKIKPLIVQRTRWSQGGIECIPKYGKLIFESPFIKISAKFEMFFYMMLPIITSIGVVGHFFSLLYNIYIVFVVKDPVNMVLAIILTLSVVISIIFGTIYGRRTEYGILKGLGMGATIPLYSMLMIPVCYRAIARFITGERKWEKTEHIVTVNTN
ncbi:MAG: glycosyltransferase [Methanobrevibacter sp.]|nr:glycosyltransferase [Methanobrevibacter sp.]